MSPLEQRVRNRVTDYLELVSAYEEQGRHEDAASVARVPKEVITNG